MAGPLNNVAAGIRSAPLKAMLATLCFLAAPALGALGLLAKELIGAPVGYQDETGFHVLRDPRGVVGQAPEAATQLAAAVSVNPPAHPRLKILVVDDQPDICELLSTYLEQDAHTVVAAENGWAALEKFRRDHFDLVITDRAMPRMDGDQLASAIRELQPSEPIILMTGFAAPDRLSTNIDLLLKKPFSLDGIREAIDLVMAA